MRTVNQWQWRRSLFSAAAATALALLVGVAPSTARACVGDCDGSGDVDVSEIIKMVNISLETAPLTTCPVADENMDGAVTVDEIIKAVNIALGTSPCSMGGCGNGTVDSGEDCDDGGLCIGGDNAGTHCTADGQCHGNGVCDGGNNIGRSCADDAGCPDSKCVHCKTFGGDGCAVNCTAETAVKFDLKPGHVTGLTVDPGTSGAVVHGDPLTIPLAITGTQTLVIGKAKDGVIPFVIPACSVRFPAIPVSNLACACTRGVEFKTCGGTVFEADGSTSKSCTAGFNGQSQCPADKPCTFVHGPGKAGACSDSPIEGNSASGTVGCGAAGLAGINITEIQNGNGTPGGMPGPVMTTITGTGPAGSARVLNTIAIGTRVGTCPMNFCTNADPLDQKGSPQTLPFTTGKACGKVLEANDDPTFDLDCGNTAEGCCSTGVPANCANLTASPPNITGLGIAGTFPAVDQPTVGDIVVTTQFFAQ